MSALQIAVCGLHLRGQPLAPALQELGATFVREAYSAPVYRLLALRQERWGKAKPGMVRVVDGGSAIYMELWDLPLHNVGTFLAHIPAPLGLGTVELNDGGTSVGFICEAYARDLPNSADDITQFGSWLEYVRTCTGSGSCQPASR